MKAMLLLLLSALALLAVDLNIEREGSHVRIWTTNNTFNCVKVEWNNGNNTNWFHYWTLYGDYGEPVAEQLSFTVKTNAQRVFWRLRDCAAP